MGVQTKTVEGGVMAREERDLKLLVERNGMFLNGKRNFLKFVYGGAHIFIVESMLVNGSWLPALFYCTISNGGLR